MVLRLVYHWSEISVMSRVLVRYGLVLRGVLMCLLPTVLWAEEYKVDVAVEWLHLTGHLDSLD